MLDVQAGTKDNGTPIVQTTTTGSKTQQWAITTSGNGDYTLVNVGNGTTFTMPSCSVSNNTGIVEANVSETPEQLWSITPVN
jgi:hypothetical protein